MKQSNHGLKAAKSNGLPHMCGAGTLAREPGYQQHSTPLVTMFICH
jgi:hypothetical protein